MQAIVPVDSFRTPTKKGRGITVALSVLAVLLGALFVASWLLFSDPYAGRGLEDVSPSDRLAETFLKSAVALQECSFTPEEVNPFLAYAFRKTGAGGEKRGVKLLAVAVAGSSGDSADVYVPLEYRGKRFGVLMNVTPSLDEADGRLLFRVNGVHVGRLPVPVGKALSLAESRLPEGFSLSGNTIYCAEPTASASVSFLSASVKLGKFRIENGALKLSAVTEISIG